MQLMHSILIIWLLIQVTSQSMFFQDDCNFFKKSTDSLLLEVDLLNFLTRLKFLVLEPEM